MISNLEQTKTKPNWSPKKVKFLHTSGLLVLPADELLMDMDPKPESSDRSSMAGALRRKNQKKKSLIKHSMFPGQIG